MKLRFPDLRESRGTMAVLLLAGLGVNAVALLLANQPLAELRARSEAGVRQLLARAEQRRREASETRRAVEDLGERRRSMDLFFQEVLSTKAERMVGVQREIREIARRHGINPDQIGYSHAPVERSREMVRFSAALPLKGNYEALRAFVHDVEHSRNYLVIDAVELVNAREGGVLLSLIIRVSTYFRDPDLATEEAGG